MGKDITTFREPAIDKVVMVFVVSFVLFSFFSISSLLNSNQLLSLIIIFGIPLGISIFFYLTYKKVTVGSEGIEVKSKLGKESIQWQDIKEMKLQVPFTINDTLGSREYQIKNSKGYLYIPNVKNSKYFEELFVKYSGLQLTSSSPAKWWSTYYIGKVLKHWS